MNQPPQQQSTLQPEKTKKKFYKKWWFWGLVVVLLAGLWLLWVWYALGDDAENDNSNDSQNSVLNLISEYSPSNNDEEDVLRDFNASFNFRKNGECDEFIKYLVKDVEEWKVLCENEARFTSDKQRVSYDIFPITEFSVNDIEINNNIATVSVDVMKFMPIYDKIDTGKNNYEFTNDYTLTRASNSEVKWMIDQENEFINLDHHIAKLDDIIYEIIDVSPQSSLDNNLYYSLLIKNLGSDEKNINLLDKFKVKDKNNDEYPIMTEVCENNNLTKDECGFKISPNETKYIDLIFVGPESALAEYNNAPYKLIIDDKAEINNYLNAVTSPDFVVSE